MNCNCNNMNRQCCECVRQYLAVILSNLGLKSAQAHLTGKGSTLLSNGDIVPFNTLLSNQNGLVTMNPDGTFTVHKAGNYNVQYFVNIDGSDGETHIRFSVNGIESQINQIQAQLNGFATLSLNNGDIISLKYATAGQVLLGAEPIQANIIITTV